MKFFKVFLIIIVVLILLAAGALGVFIATFDLDKYRQRISQEASRTLGRNVELGKLALKLSFKEGMMLKVDGAVISEKEEYGIERALEVGTVMLKLIPEAFFTKREIVVSEVLVVAPRVQVVKLEDGRINLQELAAASTQKYSDADSKSSTEEMAKSTTPPSTGAAVPNVLVEKITVSDGRVSFSDRNPAARMDVDLQDIDVSIGEFRLDKPFRVDVKAALFSLVQNVAFSGLVSLNQTTGEAAVTDAGLSVDLNALNLDEIYLSVPHVKAAALEKPLAGKLEVNLSRVNAGASGLSSMTGVIQLTGGQLKAAQLPVPLTNISLEAQLTEKVLNVRRFSAGLGTGEVVTEAVVENYLAEPQYQAQLKINRLPLAVLVPAGQLPVDVQGGLSAELKVNGRGAGPDALKNLIAEGHAGVQDGKIVGMNVLKEVLGKISMIPGAYEKVIAAMPEEWRQRLEERDTVFEKIEADFRLRDSVVVVNPMEAASYGFLLQSRANMDLDMNLRWNGDFYMPKDFSDAVIKSVPEFSYLVDEEKRIYFPLMAYEGKADKFRTLPDLEYVGKRVFVNKGQAELKKAIFKALDLEDPQTENAPEAQNSTGQEQQVPQGSDSSEQAPEKVIIENVLDTIFKKLE